MSIQTHKNKKKTLRGGKPKKPLNSRIKHTISNISAPTNPKAYTSNGKQINLTTFHKRYNANLPPVIHTRKSLKTLFPNLNVSDEKVNVENIGGKLYITNENQLNKDKLTKMASNIYRKTYELYDHDRIKEEEDKFKSYINQLTSTPKMQASISMYEFLDRAGVLKSLTNNQKNLYKNAKLTINTDIKSGERQLSPESQKIIDSLTTELASQHELDRIYAADYGQNRPPSNPIINKLSSFINGIKGKSDVINTRESEA
jgi:uncharacterized protein YxjI